MGDHKHGEMDTTTQKRTFAGFMNVAIYAVAVIFIVLIWMAIFIS